MKKENVNHRLMIVSRNVPPRFSGTSVVIENLSTGFTKEELLIVGERFLGNNLIINEEAKSKLRFITVLFKTNTKFTDILRKLQIISGFILLLFHTIRFSPKKIIIVYPSAEYLFMGYLLSKLYKADYYTYFHNTYYENRKAYKQIFAGWLQNKMFELSKVVFCISDGMRLYYEDTYKNHSAKFITLVHSYIENLPKEINVNIKGRVKFAFTGNINESCIDAANRMFAYLSKIENAEFHIYASRISEAYFYNLGIKKSKVFFYKALERNELIMQLREKDVMLLPHGFTGLLPDIEYKTIFPTKTIDYLLSGKPIIYHGPEDVYLTKILAEAQAALIISEIGELNFLSQINSLLSNKMLREKIVHNSLILLNKYSVKNVTNTINNVLYNY